MQMMELVAWKLTWTLGQQGRPSAWLLPPSFAVVHHHNRKYGHIYLNLNDRHKPTIYGCIFTNVNWVTNKQENVLSGESMGNIISEYIVNWMPPTSNLEYVCLTYYATYINFSCMLIT